MFYCFKLSFDLLAADDDLLLGELHVGRKARVAAHLVLAVVVPIRQLSRRIRSTHVLLH